MSARIREAIKTALAFALAYGFALASGWMSPVWVGLTVVVIAMPSAGQSVEKGLLRLAGTVPGCVAALVILALGAQSRWLALALTCAWMFFTTYLMLSRPSRAYLWNVAGFTALIIMTGAFESPADVFDRAQSRTVATVTGIVIYTVVTALLWPRSNAGAIRGALKALIGTQRERFNALRGRTAGGENASDLRALHLREVEQLAALDQALRAQGSESHEVREMRPELTRLRGLCEDILDCLDRLETSTPTEGAVRASSPTIDAFLDEIDARFGSMLASLGLDGEAHAPTDVSLALDREALAERPPLDRAAVVVMRGQLATLDRLTVTAGRCIRDLVDDRAGGDASDAELTPLGAATISPGYDLDHLRGAALVTATVLVGFVLWVFVNPPGHAGWVTLPPILAMMVAGRQQLNATVFIGPTAVALALGIAVYVFVLPRLSTFAELGVVLFLAMFAVNYFFRGIGVLAGMIGVLMGISIQQPQTFSFAAMANSYIFTLGSFVLVYAMSYMIQSPRPEKAVLHLIRRFFRSGRFLLASVGGYESTGPFARWRIAWHRQELRRLPSKIEAWSRSIAYRGLPADTPARLEALVTRMQAIVYRIDELLDAEGATTAKSLATMLADDICQWRARLESVLAEWESRPSSPAAETLREHLSEWRKRVDGRIEALGQSLDDEREQPLLDDEDWRRFYALLGGYRGVSATLLAYDDQARGIDWVALQEERFS